MAKHIGLSRKDKSRYLKEMGLDEEEVNEFLKSQKKGKPSIGEAIVRGYSLYKINKFGRMANFFMEELSTNLIKSFPKFFEKLFFSIRKSGIKILSRTYISIILFCTLLGFLVLSILSFLLFLDGNIILGVVKAIFSGIIFSIIVFWALYFYPALIIGTRQKKIKNELPFVILHMTAVAGSGAHPISMFKLVLEAGEYPEIEGEIRKIVNYVNLFGYDLTSALKAVTTTTPSEDFRELLNGMVATVETGGDLKNYLTEKSKDAMNKYKIERKKYVKTLSTYSDIYTALLIAAPLLFIVALAIINVIGGTIGSFTVGQIAKFGTYGAIPLLNILFIVFITVMQPEK